MVCFRWHRNVFFPQHVQRVHSTLQVSVVYVTRFGVTIIKGLWGICNRVPRWVSRTSNIGLEISKYFSGNIGQRFHEEINRKEVEGSFVPHRWGGALAPCNKSLFPRGRGRRGKLMYARDIITMSSRVDERSHIKPTCFLMHHIFQNFGISEF